MFLFLIGLIIGGKFGILTNLRSGLINAYLKCQQVALFQFHNKADQLKLIVCLCLIKEIRQQSFYANNLIADDLKCIVRHSFHFWVRFCREHVYIAIWMNNLGLKAGCKRNRMMHRSLICHVINLSERFLSVALIGTSKTSLANGTAWYADVPKSTVHIRVAMIHQQKQPIMLDMQNSRLYVTSMRL